ncbi:MAG TPA: HNH endonuclease signature motif containing protein [Spirillospora sp.]|nr:HNH endonuclease signature motif containing protein [Spirillospora sp.]
MTAAVEKPARPSTRRGTSSANARGSSEERRRRKEWLVTAWRADVDLSATDGWHRLPVPLGTGIPACRCFRCGRLLTVETVTPDRIVPGCDGGTYRRNNLRPACLPCNTKTGGQLGGTRRRR